MPSEPKVIEFAAKCIGATEGEVVDGKSAFTYTLRIVGDKDAVGGQLILTSARPCSFQVGKAYPVSVG